MGSQRELTSSQGMEYEFAADGTMCHFVADERPRSNLVPPMVGLLCGPASVRRGRCDFPRSGNGNSLFARLERSWQGSVAKTASRTSYRVLSRSNSEVR